MLAKVAIFLVFVSSTHAMYNNKNSCLSRQSCPNNKLCVHNECRKYQPDIDCSKNGGNCRRGFCCMMQSPDMGRCVRKPNLRLQYGDYCFRSADCNYCQCDTGLVCTKSGISFYPEPQYTCRSNDTDGDCTHDDQCANDRCCSSSKCKPKRKKGERCYPKAAPEAFLECLGDCIAGTECMREASGGPSYYTCKTKLSGKPVQHACT